MLKFTDPERLCNKEGSREYTKISLGKRNRKDLVGCLGASGDRKRRDQIGGGAKVGEMTGIREHLGDVMVCRSRK